MSLESRLLQQRSAIVHALETREYGPGKTLSDMTKELVEIQHALLKLAEEEVFPPKEKKRQTPRSLLEKLEVVAGLHR